MNVKKNNVRHLATREKNLEIEGFISNYMHA